MAEGKGELTKVVSEPMNVMTASKPHLLIHFGIPWNFAYEKPNQTKKKFVQFILSPMKQESNLLSQTYSTDMWVVSIFSSNCRQETQLSQFPVMSDCSFNV